MNINQELFIRIAKHPVKFRMFLLFNLPSAFFSRIKIDAVNENQSQVSVPFTWFTKNPFRSTYFACLAMAAELSTGVLVMMNLYKRKPVCSMLVQNCSADFTKKATGFTDFTCLDGILISDTIEKAYLTNEPQVITVLSEGRNSNNEIIASFYFTWSFKVKTDC